MPQTVAIGLLVLGSVLLLVALLGGNFRLFGTEISEKVLSKGLRWTAGVLGFMFVWMAVPSVNPVNTQNEKYIQPQPMQFNPSELGPKLTSSENSRRFPSGFILIPCGCYGYTVNGSSYQEPRCQSGFLMTLGCPWTCPMGGYAYNGTCM